MATSRFRRSERFYFFGAACLLVTIAFLNLKPRTKPHNLSWTHPGVISDAGNSQPSTAVVVAALEKDDVSWIDFAWWNVWKYEVDNPKARHAVPENKGHEAMVYLTHIINEYDNLTQRLIFIHAGRYQWHNDDPRYDGKKSLQNLRLEYLDQKGYLNLRCHWFQGCSSAMNLTSTSYLDPFRENPTASLEQLYASTFRTLFPSIPIPAQVGAACCSQFAVTASTIRRRPKEEYINIRKWLLETEMEDYMSGRVLEYMWHILFGKEAVNCPNAEACYCRMYGKCGLRCGEGDCRVYQYPFDIPILKTWWWKLRHAFG